MADPSTDRLSSRMRASRKFAGHSNEIAYLNRLPRQRQFHLKPHRVIRAVLSEITSRDEIHQRGRSRGRYSETA